MSKIYLAHPNPSVRKALIQTFKSVLPEAEFTAEESPSDGQTAVFTLSADKPRRLKTLTQALLRQTAGGGRPASIVLGGNRLDVHAREFFMPDGESIMLTEKEVDVLVYLSRRTAPATREDLLNDVWNYAPDVDTHTIETHIYRLRQKIEPDAENPRILLTTKDGYQLASTAASNA